MSNHNKIGIIIGAGASAAINPNRIPVMNNFFEIVSKFSKHDGQVAKALKTLQKHGLVSRGKIPEGNLEDVLTQTLSISRDQDDPWKRPYDGLLLTFHRIFHRVDKEDISCYVDCFSPLCKLNPNDVIFISFNYDVFLERALEALFSWRADLGYSPDVLVGHINAEQAEKAQDPTQVCDEVYAWSLSVSDRSKVPTVLKPHGSLNWFIHSRGKGHFWMSEETLGLLLMQPANKKVCIPRFWIYPTTNTTKGELADPEFLVGAILPAIIPPGKKFSTEIPVFRRIQKSVIETLSQISSLVIIGWSMRQSDKKYSEWFKTAGKTRQSDLKLLGVCNLHRKKEFYSRFEDQISSKKFLRCDDGFVTKQTKQFIEKVVKVHSG